MQRDEPSELKSRLADADWSLAGDGTAPLLKTMKLCQDRASGILKISGELHFDQGKRLQACVLSYLENHDQIVLDLSAVESCDAAALQVFLAARKSASAMGKPFRFAAISQAINQNSAALGISLLGEASA